MEGKALKFGSEIIKTNLQLSSRVMKSLLKMMFYGCWYNCRIEEKVPWLLTEKAQSWWGHSLLYALLSVANLVTIWSCPSLLPVIWYHQYVDGYISSVPFAYTINHQVYLSCLEKVSFLSDQFKFSLNNCGMCNMGFRGVRLYKE